MDEQAIEQRPSGPAALREEWPEHGFAHASEAEFARILDFYEVAWEYEKHVFPILWDLDGNVLESFAPDFFLPDLDVFVELTTLQQRLVRKKNRKVRRMRELYPSLRIKLFYARDFQALMLKFGRAALVSELSGSMGQVQLREERPDDSTPGPGPLPAVAEPPPAAAESAVGPRSPIGTHQRSGRSSARTTPNSAVK